ncbi:hypothetical protein J3F84DRAFT_374542 [Trichoderma pleuroticola]
MALPQSATGLRVPEAQWDISADLSARSSRRSLRSRLSDRRPKSRSRDIEAEIQGEHQTAETPKTINASIHRSPIEVLYNGRADKDSIDVDIIAVHGLGSNVDWSWTWRDTSTGSTVHWLRDTYMLPSIVPNARIMAYNYDSKWNWDAPKTRLELCGEDLIICLHSFRQREGVQDRPILFIGHSLGGLVIEYGLLHAKSTPQYKSLLDYSIGFISLGTPFRGSQMQGLAKTAARFLSMGGSHKGIIGDLALNNQTLLDKLHGFCRLRDEISLPACCFFELKQTNYGTRLRLPSFIGLFKGIVVPEDSACVPGWKRVPLETDHLKMNKYSSPTDRSFLHVSDQIAAMCGNYKSVLKGRKGSTHRGHFVVPFKRNDAFVGRKIILKQLLARIFPSIRSKDHELTSLEGVVGVGKTETAVELAYLVRDEFPDCSIFWVSGHTKKSLLNSYRDIGTTLNVEGLSEEAAVIPLVKDAISRQDNRWLLLVDNASALEQLYGDMPATEYLPSGHQGSIVLTARDHEFNGKVGVAKQGVITLPMMDRIEASILLRQGLVDDVITDEASMDQLLKALQGFPMAIKQAAAFMANTKVSSAQYLERYNSIKTTLTELLQSIRAEDRNPKMSKHKHLSELHVVLTTCLAAYNYLKQESPAAADALQFFSCLAENDIQISLLETSPVDEIITRLSTYELVRKHHDCRCCIDTYPGVQMTMQILLRAKGELQDVVARILGRITHTIPLPSSRNRSVWMDYQAHVQNILNLAEGYASTIHYAHLLFWMAQGHETDGNYRDAEHLHRQALERREQLLGEKHFDTLSSMNSLGMLFNECGRYQEAEQIHRRTLQLCKDTLGEAHPATYESMNNLAVCLQKQGQFEESLQLHQEVLRAGERVYGKGHLFTCRPMANIAQLLQEQGKYQESEEMNRQALEIREKLLGKEHLDTLSSMNNLGVLLLDQGKYEEAAKLQRETLRIKQKVLSKDHPLILTTMNNLAAVLHPQGLLKEAEQLHREILDIRRRTLGEESHDTLMSMNNLAAVIDDQGRLKEGEYIHRETLRLREKTLGKENPATLQTMRNLSINLKLQGSLKESEAMTRATLELQKRIRGEEHPDTLTSMDDLSAIFLQQKKLEEAGKLLQKTFKLREKVLGEKHPNTEATRASFRWCLEMQGKGREEAMTDV